MTDIFIARAIQGASSSNLLQLEFHFGEIFIEVHFAGFEQFLMRKPYYQTCAYKEAGIGMIGDKFRNWVFVAKNDIKSSF